MNNRKTGSIQEERAACWLEGQGYEILERNYRCSLGEIDLIARQDSCLVFIEVKYRKNRSKGLPEEAISHNKMRTICRVARHYLMMQGSSGDTGCRFDVIAIEGTDLRHYENAFPFV